MDVVGMDKKDTEIDILWLNEDDMIKAGVFDAGKCVDVMEETMGLFADGDFIMGGPKHDAHGLMLEFPKKSEIENFPLNDSRDRRFIAMPAYLGGRFHIAGEKWYGSNGRNRSRGLPRSILMTVLNDVETGAPLAFMSANLLSSMRTGAMPGLATKLLANPDSETLAIIGPGVISKACFLAIMSKMERIKNVKIKGSSPASKSAVTMKEFILNRYPDLKVDICGSMEEAVKDADIISEAVSCKAGDWPEVKAEWLKPGATMICTSTFNMEYNSIKDIKKVVDSYGMYENYAKEDQMGYDENGVREHTGCMGEDFVYMVEDGLIKKDSILSLGEIVRGRQEGRTSKDEVILVSIEGMPIEDVAWGYECYKTAKKKGIGKSLKLWDAPKLF